MGRVQLCPPNADIANFGTKVGAATFYGCVDEDPNDGDTTGIRGVAGENRLGVDWSGIASDEIITKIVVRWAESGVSAEDLLASAGLWIDAVSYSGPQRVISPFAGGYLVSDEEFPVNPATGLPWQVPDLVNVGLVHQQISLPEIPEVGRPRLSQLVAFAYLEGPVDHADGSSSAARAAASGSAPTAAGTGAAPRAGASSTAPGATGAATDPMASADGTAPVALGLSTAPRATPAAPGTVFATVASGAPRATATPAGPRATASAPDAGRAQGD